MLEVVAKIIKWYKFFFSGHTKKNVGKTFEWDEKSCQFAYSETHVSGPHVIKTNRKRNTENEPFDKCLPYRLKYPFEKLMCSVRTQGGVK